MAYRTCRLRSSGAWQGVCPLTAGVTLLVAAIQTVVVSVALPQGPYAALIVTLELIAFAPLRLRGAARGFWRQGGLEGEGGETKLTGDFLWNISLEKVIGAALMALKRVNSVWCPPCSYWDSAGISAALPWMYPHLHLFCFMITIFRNIVEICVGIDKVRLWSPSHRKEAVDCWAYWDTMIFGLWCIRLIHYFLLPAQVTLFFSRSWLSAQAHTLPPGMARQRVPQPP